MNDHQHRLPSEDELDEALAQTFPASDPPGNTVETGIRLDAEEAPADRIRDNRTAHRFELVTGEQLAFLSYERKADALVLIHTEVPPSLRGRHIGDALIRAALDAARAERLRIVPVCPFVKAYLRKHPVC